MDVHHRSIGGSDLDWLSAAGRGNGDPGNGVFVCPC